MTRYLLRRLGLTVVQLLGISMILFLLSKAVPGDYLSGLNPQISPETIAALRHRYGLDQPLAIRYLRWLGSVVSGDFGYSFAYNLPVSTLLWPKILHTLLLTGPALALTWLIAIPVGVWTAWRRDGWMDRVVSAGVSVLLSLPDLLLAIVLLLFALLTGLFPVGEMSSEAARDQGGWRLLIDILWHMVLPVSVLVAGALPMILRHVRASMIESLASSNIRAAQGHGIGPSALLFRHCLRMAANPLISLFGLSVAGLLSTSIIVEIVVGWPGIGPTVVEATLARDLYVVIGAALFSMLFLALGNFLMDLLLYVADPRIRVRP